MLREPIESKQRLGGGGLITSRDNVFNNNIKGETRLVNSMRDKESREGATGFQLSYHAEVVFPSLI